MNEQVRRMIGLAIAMLLLGLLGSAYRTQASIKGDYSSSMESSGAIQTGVVDSYPRGWAYFVR